MTIYIVIYETFKDVKVNFILNLSILLKLSIINKSYENT